MMMMTTMRVLRASGQRCARRFATNAQQRERVEYPTSFLAHMKTQKLNVFNIGVTFLTMSLASQLVSYKQRNQAITAEKEQLEERVEVLEALVKSLGGTLPNAEEVAANQEKLAAEKAEAEKAAAAAEERAIAAALVGGSDGKKKGMLI